MDHNAAAVRQIAGLFPMVMLFDTTVDEGEEFVRPMIHPLQKAFGFGFRLSAFTRLIPIFLPLHQLVYLYSRTSRGYCVTDRTRGGGQAGPLTAATVVGERVPNLSARATLQRLLDMRSCVCSSHFIFIRWRYNIIIT